MKNTVFVSSYKFQTLDVKVLLGEFLCDTKAQTWPKPPLLTFIDHTKLDTNTRGRAPLNE